MCGICGWIEPGREDTGAMTREMTRRLRHRGPDDAGREGGRGWSLGFRRLSILDLSPAGHQPMRSPDGRRWLAFNGEIYNYVELRRELEQAGERFAGTSDTEVLLRLLIRHGEAALSRLNGMFALAFVDLERRTFLLARDRLGVKPLYYRQDGSSLRFASEPKALLAWPGEAPGTDTDAVAQYLTLGYLPSESCIFRGYAKLAPGHVLAGPLDDPAATRPRPYWALALNPDPSARALAPAELDELEALFVDAVRIRLRSDVPVGVFLSGGIDSGLVAAVAARAEGVRPLALTVGFAESCADESALAGVSAAHAGLEHRVVAQPIAGLERIDELARFYDEPFGDPSALPTFTLCEVAASHATVFLSGDGGDEAFGGYRRVVDGLRRRHLIGLGSRVGPMLRAVEGLAPELSLLRHRLHKLGLADHGCAAAFDEVPDDPALMQLVPPDLRPALRRGGAPLWTRWAQTRGLPLTVRQQDLDYRLYLPDDILVKVDRASMAHSIEVRSPLLDVRLVEWAARLPRSCLFDGRRGKLPLRALAARLLPEAVRTGAKRGFGVPHDVWLRSAHGQDFVRARLLDRRSLSHGFWTAAGVERILARMQQPGGRNFGTLIWRLLMLEAWSRCYTEARDRPEVSRERRVSLGAA
ncbi:MAG: asparagine synthase (glutamine-hydrolyzing) [Methylobacterium frigidaeris]